MTCVYQLFYYGYIEECYQFLRFTISISEISYNSIIDIVKRNLLFIKVSGRCLSVVADAVVLVWCDFLVLFIDLGKPVIMPCCKAQNTEEKELKNEHIDCMFQRLNTY